MFLLVSAVDLTVYFVSLFRVVAAQASDDELTKLLAGALVCRSQIDDSSHNKLHFICTSNQPTEKKRLEAQNEKDVTDKDAERLGKVKKISMKCVAVCARRRVVGCRSLCCDCDIRAQVYTRLADIGADTAQVSYCCCCMIVFVSYRYYLLII